ncbi:MAG: LPS assembly protein LptD [Desulfovermiculus sp.]|nr:LPS assembly protein LptD [Desulfovermiculus sp.]
MLHILRIPCLRLVWSCFATLVLLIILNQVAIAQPRSLPIDSASGDEPWVLRAESMQVFEKRKVVEAQDNVLLTRGDDSLQADFARYYWDTNWIYLQGNIRVRFGSDTLQAETAEFDLKNDVGWLTNGRVFLEESHLYVTGERIKKTGPESYSFDQAEITACDGPNPAWSLQTSRGTVALDGYAHLSHPRFKIKGQPVLYSPYLVLPAKKRRQSGILMPELSTGSRNGLSLNLPYYQVLGPDRDATVYANMMRNRGVMFGLEYRTTPDLLTKGYFRADWLDDSLKDTDEDNDQFQDDPWKRPNSERYWIRGKYNGKLFTPDWKTKFDVDLVSDQDYLRDFDSGISGFEESRDIFLSEFGRDIQDKDDLKRVSTFLASRNWAQVGLYSQLEYTQDLKYINDNLSSSQNPTLQRLPQIDLDFFQSRLLSTPLQWKAQNQMTYFWREFGTTGVRTDLHPQISLPASNDYGTVIPRLGWRQTLYALDRVENASNVDGKSHTRGLFDAQITAFTSFKRIFDFTPSQGAGYGLESPGESQWTGIKHTLQPELEWNYIPDEDQDDLPDFDALDRIEPENELTYSLQSVFTRRKVTLRAPEENGATPKLTPSYRDFLLFELEQSYDFREATRNRDRNTYPRRPFSDIRAELQLRPSSWLSVHSKTWFSPYETTLTEHEHYLRVRPKPNASVFFGLDYQKEMPKDIRRKDQNPINVVRAGGTYRLSPSWLFGVDIKQDLENSEIIHQRVNIGYRHQCWGLDVEFERTEYEDKATVMISLLQIGQFGQDISTERE